MQRSGQDYKTLQRCILVELESKTAVKSAKFLRTSVCIRIGPFYAAVVSESLRRKDLIDVYTDGGTVYRSIRI